MDMYERSYQMVYGTGAAKDVDTFFQNSVGTRSCAWSKRGDRG
jgi:hypothetical protein